jgi:tetratricopeptide (TPR) repeat protein
MLDNFLKFLIKNFRTFFVLSAFFLSHNSLAKDSNYIATGDIVKDIEKTLLFDKESREKIDFYKQKKPTKKTAFEIRSGAQNSGVKNGAIDIIISDSKAINLDVREQEKLAYNAYEVDQYEVAIQLYKQVINAEPDNYNAKFALAITYQQMGQLTQAKNIYHDLLKSDFDKKDEIISNLLTILIEESPRDAVYVLTRLLKQNPQSPIILAQSAIAYEKLKDYEKAVTALQTAVSLDQGNIIYKYNLAVIYDKISQYEKALDLYSAVMKNNSEESREIPMDQVKKRIEFIKARI